jgi:hypothetical protein
MHLAKIVVPSFLAGVGLAIALGALQHGAPLAADAPSYSPAAEPTPYSADHGRVQKKAGSDEVQPSTF